MDATAAYGIEALAADLRRITAETDDHKEIVRQVMPLAQKAADASATWMKEAYYGCNEEQGFGVHLLHEEPNHDLAIFAVAWLPGRGTPPHDHGTWAVVAGIDGDETNINWRRLDDGSVPGHAQIEEANRITARRGDVLAFLPRDIHTVWNDTDKVNVSLHIYGRHLNHTGRSQFDPAAGTEEQFIVTVE